MLKNFMSKLAAVWILSILTALTGTTAMASPAEGSDADQLKWMLARAAEVAEEDIVFFEYADYDGDGNYEAFALIGTQEQYGGWTGDLWFAGSLFMEPVKTGGSYYDVSVCGDKAPILFSAEEWYGGSGSKSLLWTVVNSQPVEVKLGEMGDFTHGGGNVFYATHNAFDLCTDGTGHTWKQYYYYLDGLNMKEYGGIYISKEDFMRFQGGDAILADAMKDGFSVTEIIYRANGIININLSDGMWNKFLTVEYDATSVRLTDYCDGGFYLLAATPESAVYPDQFIAPELPETVPEVRYDGEKAVIWNELGVYDFNHLKSVYVSGVTVSASRGLQDILVRLQPEVNMGGSEGYWEHWTTESGVLCDKALDLDGDGQDEVLVLYSDTSESEGGDTYGASGQHLAIFEPDAGSYIKAADFDCGVSLFPNYSSSAIRILNTDQGLIVAVLSEWYGDGGSSDAGISMYRYDGQAVRLCAHAKISNLEDSYFVAADLPVGSDADIMENSGYEQDVAAYLMSHYNLTRDQDFYVFDGKLNEAGFGTRDYGGYDMAAEHLKAYGLSLVYTLRSYDDDENGAYMEDYQLSGGNDFFLCKDQWEDGSCSVRMLLDTTLDHFSKGAASESEQPADNPAGVRSTAYTTGSVNLRTGPGLGYEILTSVPTGQNLEYLGESSVDERGVTWYKVRYREEEMWGSSKYIVVYLSEQGFEIDASEAESLEESSIGSNPVNEAYAYTTGDVSLRSGPGLGYQSLCVVPNGTRLIWKQKEEVDERGVIWYYISYDGVLGWGSSKYVYVED